MTAGTLFNCYWMMLLLFILNRVGTSYQYSSITYRSLTPLKSLNQITTDINRKVASVIRTSKTSLFSSVDESIVPTVYRRDLYGVLGVSKTATREELRDAYWAIAAKNHPDRNQTREALELFRNASYAYQVLGRDEKLRRSYDAKYVAKDYLDALESVGMATSDLLVPLTMEIAVPLLNMTAQAIGNVAIPFLKNAFEQSNAALRAASDDDSMFDPFTRATMAIERTSFQQQIKKQMDTLSSHYAVLQAKFQEYEIAQGEENDIQKLVRELKENRAATAFRIRQLTSAKSSGASVLTDLANRDATMTSSIELYDYNIEKLTEKSEEKSKVILSREEEILQLERALAAAKKALQEDQDIFARYNAEINELKEKLEITTKEKIELDDMSTVAARDFAMISQELIDAEKRVLSCDEDIMKNENLLVQIKQNKDEVAKKLTTLQTKKELFEAQLRALENKRKEKEKYFEKKRAELMKSKGKLLP